MKIYNAVFIDAKGQEKKVPVAAQSLKHAATKAAKEEQHGELVKVELTKEIVI